MADKKEVVKNEVNKIEVYKELTKYHRPEDVPKDEILKKYGINDRQYGAC